MQIETAQDIADRDRQVRKLQREREEHRDQARACTELTNMDGRDRSRNRRSHLDKAQACTFQLNEF